MELRELKIEDHTTLEKVLGYLNFSSGASDAKFLANLNLVFAWFEQTTASGPTAATSTAAAGPAPWQAVLALLEAKLQSLRTDSAAFRDADQAASVLELVRAQVLPGYRRFHADLLFHQTEAGLFNSLFVGRVCEAVLQQGSPWEQADRIRRGAIGQLNDYLGIRPVATLEGQPHKPYTHEWSRPIPIFIRGVGAAAGRYQAVVEATIQLLEQTDEDILRDAFCDPAMLEELAFDARAYDFDHPVNKRPNYHFGQWDPHRIDQRGFYRRYVVQQVTLDSLMERYEQAEGGLPREELLFEAAAVFAGTIIMSTGISGAGPDSHDSTVSLSTLLPKIAAYRDQFYERLLKRLKGEHGKRLRAEAETRRQPFGGARQHLNAALARRRASQLEHVHLAMVFARMGFPDAAAKEADIVPAASARMLCQIECRLASGELAVSRGDLELAARMLDEIRDWLRRGIDCGAILDPWNILGFDANFSLFPSVENTVRDHRADELVMLVEQVFALYSRVWSDAAARHDETLSERVATRFRDLADWWRQFAVHEVSSVEAVDAEDAFRAGEHVAGALKLWHGGGAAAEDLAFWNPHAEMFDAPKAYALVIDALLTRGDLVASMGLLVHWLGKADTLGLDRGDTSFFALAEQWMLAVRRRAVAADHLHSKHDPWRLARKFLDYIEANAEDFWSTPGFQLGEPGLRTGGRRRPIPGPARGFDDDFPGDEFPDHDGDDEDDGELSFPGAEQDDDDDGDPYGASRDGVIYHDTTDDGIDSSLGEARSSPSDEELVAESKRLAERLAFHTCLARLWQLAATIGPLTDCERGDAPASDRCEAIFHWLDQAARNRRGLKQLIDQIQQYPLPEPGGDQDAMVQYDRVRQMKESLLEQVIGTAVEVTDAARVLLAAVYSSEEAMRRCAADLDFARCEMSMVATFSAILRGNLADFRGRWPSLIQCLAEQPLLYVPLSKNGDPHSITTARVLQHGIQDMLACLPRLGLIVETCELIETAREMERRNAVGHGAVTEFDELFKIGYKALVEMIVHSAPTWSNNASSRKASVQVVDCLKRLTESLLSSWLAHSKTLRLSVLEKVKGRREWNCTVEFIETYGQDIFTQRFFNLANIRAILHQGVSDWLEQVERESPEEFQWRLFDDLDSGKLSLEDAAGQLSLVLEAIAENYGEYRDYNSMTTQSDRGELLYMLLDFLRLRIQYDRICWQLRPVIWTHEILVRRNEKEAARIWRRELTEQTHQQAQEFLQKLAELQTQYAMRMPTVADRLGERFVRPMAIDRTRALVGPAIEEARRGGPHPTFDLLHEETQELTKTPTGVGLDVPAWLVALEEELDSVTEIEQGFDENFEIEAVIPQATLPLSETHRQLQEWSSRK